MKCLQCNGAEIGFDTRAILQHARAVHNQSLAEWKQAHEKLSLSYPEDHAIDFGVDGGETIAEELERNKSG
jgi:hypothetical protein